MIIRALLLTSLAALLTIATANDASAGVCDLTTNGASCGPSLFTNFAIFGEVSPQPTGTGYIDPFLRLQASGSGSRDTTRARGPSSWTRRSPINFTHDLLLSAVPVKTIDGVQYREFFLDINESKNQTSFVARRAPYLSVRRPANVDSYDATTKTLERPERRFTIWTPAATTGSSWTTASIMAAVPATWSRTFRTACLPAPARSTSTCSPVSAINRGTRI